MKSEKKTQSFGTPYIKHMFSTGLKVICCERETNMVNDVECYWPGGQLYTPPHDLTKNQVEQMLRFLEGPQN